MNQEVRKTGKQCMRCRIGLIYRNFFLRPNQFGFWIRNPECAGYAGKVSCIMRLMRNSKSFRSLEAAVIALLLCSCDLNLFGPDLKEIAGGYRLKKAQDPAEFSLTIPYQSGGLIINEIGWHK